MVAMYMPTQYAYSPPLVKRKMHQRDRFTCQRSCTQSSHKMRIFLGLSRKRGRELQSNVGDVDGDGVPDLAVGAFFQDVGGNTRQGQVFIFSGNTGSLLHTLDDPTPQLIAYFGS